MCGRVEKGVGSGMVVCPAIGLAGRGSRRTRVKGRFEVLGDRVRLWVLCLQVEAEYER